MKNLIAALVLSMSLLATPAAATSSASAFIESLGNEALATLANKQITKEQSVATFKKILNENFDVPAISRFVLGRAWNTASEAERTEYTRLFNKLVEQIYLDRFGTYSGETFKIIGEAPAGTDDKIVRTQIMRTNGGPPVAVDWRLKPQPANKSAQNGYRITDVIVEGVSMSVTQRQEFASVLQQNGGKVEALLNLLRQKTGEVATAAK